MVLALQSQPSLRRYCKAAFWPALAAAVEVWRPKLAVALCLKPLQHADVATASSTHTYRVGHWALSCCRTHRRPDSAAASTPQRHAQLIQDTEGLFISVQSRHPLQLLIYNHPRSSGGGCCRRCNYSTGTIKCTCASAGHHLVVVMNADSPHLLICYACINGSPLAADSTKAEVLVVARQECKHLLRKAYISERITNSNQCLLLPSCVHHTLRCELATQHKQSQFVKVQARMSSHPASINH
jgi:hypothetical protein